MLQMILYSITIMYTPGPVTITAANLGLNGRFKNGIPFYFGISFAIFVQYMILGYFSIFLTKMDSLWPISLIGGVYMLYLAYKIFFAEIDLSKGAKSNIGFREGFLMQAFNPKAFIAVTPVITIYFPMLNVHGIGIFYMALFFMALCFGAPALYALVGQFFSRFFQEKKSLRLFNRVMSTLLVYISCSTMYHYVFLHFYPG